MPICGIYKIANKVNGKCYIGQSINVKRRWREHLKAYKTPDYHGYNYPLYQAIRFYGLENFSFEVLEECQPEKLNEKEIYWIEVFKSYDDGYNQDRGGNNFARFTKLSEGDIPKIFDELKNTTKSTEEIGADFGVSGRVIREINAGREFPVSGIEYPIRKPFSVCSGKITCQPHPCPICGTMTKNKIYCSPKCSAKGQESAGKPPREELKEMIRSIPFLTLGKQFAVSDNTIRKWCKSYNLPFRRRDINSISDEDWVNI